MKTLHLSTTILLIAIIIQQHPTYARPDAQQQQQEHNASSGDRKQKKQIDPLRHYHREQLPSSSDVSPSTRTFHEQSSSTENNDFQIKFHKRQAEKQARLDELHAQVSETLAAHHSGRHLLSDQELESHTKKQMALERKRKSLREESTERYLERMKRHEEKLGKKVERKERRREERFRKMMGKDDEEL